MSQPLQSEHLATLQKAARDLVQQAGEHAAALRAFVSDSEIHVQHAEAALGDCFDGAKGGVDRLHSVLSAQVQRSHDGVKAATQLFTGADAQRAAANGLLVHLDRAFSTNESTAAPGLGVAVLVVDDHRDVREVVAEVLRIAGFNVRTAANGLEGLLAAYEVRPTVIVMDFTMPVLDGIEATRLIKAHEATRAARVIAYTGNPVPDDSGAQRLFAAVLQKPATPAAILAAVEQAVSL